MYLSERQTYLVQSTYQLIEPINDVMGELFYARLFEIQPGLAHVFPNGMWEQGRKLMQMVAFAVKGLEQPEQVEPSLQDLGKRHAIYGVRPEHYKVIGESLLWALEQGLGNRFTSEVRDAWAMMYASIALTMMKAAY